MKKSNIQPRHLWRRLLLIPHPRLQLPRCRRPPDNRPKLNRRQYGPQFRNPGLRRCSRRQHRCCQSPHRCCAQVLAECNNGKLFNQSSFTAHLKLTGVQEELLDVSCRMKSQMQCSRMLSELRRDPVCFFQYMRPLHIAITRASHGTRGRYPTILALVFFRERGAMA
jgi:hypothetical protein